MINTSDAYKTAIQGNCEFGISDKITFTSKETLTLSMDDLMSYTIKEATSESGKFQCGAAVIKEYSIALDNTEGKFSKYSFSGADILAVVGLKLADGSWEYLNKGTYRIVQAKETGQIINIKAYDSMLFFDRQYSRSKLKYPATVLQIVQNACTDCGLTFDASTVEMRDFVVQTRPENDTLTYRDIIGYCAQLMGCYARINHLDRLEFSWYSTEESHEISDLITSSIDTDNITITGVRVILSSDEKTSVDNGDETYMILLDNNPLIQSEASAKQVADHVGEKVIGLSFRPYSVSTVADPSLEAGDYVNIVFDNGERFEAPVTNTTFSIGGAQSIECTAESAAEKEYVKYTAATKIVTKAKENVERQLAGYDVAIQNMNQLAANTFGFYATVVKQADGSTIAYRHDKPLLEESKVVYKSGIDGFFVTQDYQGTDAATTWRAGFDSGGNATMNILSAIGINADYVDSGALTVKDADGNIIFQADISGGKVIISGDSVKIGDRNVTEALQQVTEDVASAKNMAFTLSNTYLSVPVDNDGNYKSFPGDATIKPNVMYGTVDITDACAYFISKSSGISGKWDANNRVYTVTGLSTDTGWIDFTALYATSLKVTKRFTAAKLYAGAKGDKGSDGRSYILDSSVPMIQLDGDNFHIPSAVTFSAYYRDGDSEERKSYIGRFKIETTSDGTTWSTIYTSSQNESSVTRVLDYVLCDDDGSIITDENGNMISTTPRKLSEIRCTLYQAGGMSTVIDSMSVPGVVAAKQITQEELFNILTNNGKAKGLFFEGGQLYISFTYAKGGQLVLGGVNNGRGELYVYDGSGNVVGSWTKDGIDAKKGTFSGNLNASKISGSTVTGSKITGSTIDGTTITSKGTVEDIQRNVEIQNGYVGINMGAAYDVETLQKVGALTAVRTDLSTPYGGAVVVSQRNAIGIQSNSVQGAAVIGFGDRDSGTWDETPLIVYPTTKINGVTWDSIVSMTQAHAQKVSADIFQLGNASSGKIYGSAPYFRKNTSNHPIRLAVTDGSSTDAYNTYFDIFGSVDVTGTLKVSGTKNRAVKTSCGTVLLNALETPEAVFADFGSAIISATGSVHIFIDPLFAETIDTDCKYQAFLTKTSNGGIDYVEKHTDHMIVYGKAQTEFDWFIAARQKEYSADRLNMTEPMAAQPVAFDDSVFVDETEEINNAWKYLDITENTMIEMLEETIC